VTVGGELQSFRPVAHQIHLVARFGEAPFHVLADGTVVFDDEELHPATGR
jgi:hypothetical protein